LRELGAPLLDGSGAIPYLAVQHSFDGEYPVGRCYYSKSVYLPGLPDEVVKALAARGRQRPSALSSNDVWPLGGAMARVPTDATPIAQRDAAYLIGIEANWDDPVVSPMNPTYDFTGEVALVTGAASGMGLATARAFAESSAAVVLADVDAHALRDATDGLTALGHQALAVVCDVADQGQVEAMIERSVRTFGRLDMAFNNAGIQVHPSDAADEPGETFDRVTAINLRGVWNCMKHEQRQMRTQGNGAIVNCSSLGGLAGLPGRATYHAAKHGVIGLTRSAALEYASRGVRINAVCPGPIDTPMIREMFARGEGDARQAAMDQPIGRLGREDEIAAAVLWLCSPGASLVIGVALPVDGGYTAR
jgi:NAD(P)-dependent dehydrogenase (short-subunit alcohol dehydrogenase family)